MQKQIKDVQARGVTRDSLASYGGKPAINDDREYTALANKNDSVVENWSAMSSSDLTADDEEENEFEYLKHPMLAASIDEAWASAMD